MPDAVTAFEQSFARWIGRSRALAFWKARVALYAFLRALGVGEGDEVVLPGYTCVMNVNPIKYVGATPIYVDILPDTYNMDPALLEPAISPRTKVILAQHTYGYPCEMDAILDIAGRRGLPVVEDCCLTLGSKYKGKVCGTFGAAAYWSFQWSKPFTTGLGGVAATDDTELAGLVQALCDADLADPSPPAALMLAAQRMAFRLLLYPRTTAALTSLFRWLVAKGLIVGSSAGEEYTPTMPEGFFTGMSAGQARAGLRQMAVLEPNLAHRRELAKLYDELLRQAGWNMPAIPDYMESVLVRYPVRVADKARAIAEAPRYGVELGTWFECPLHPIETPMDRYDYREGMCPVAEKACREVVNLPTHPRADEATARRSVEFLRTIGPAA